VVNQIPAETAEAMAALFRAEARGLFGYASTLPNVTKPDAEDLVQVTFQEAALAWERLGSLDEETRRKWLYRVLRNKAIDQWRAHGSRQSSWEQIDTAVSPALGTYRAALSSIALQRCWDMIKLMPQARQRIAFLKWGEEWSSAEIARLMGISQSTVRGQLKLARDELAVAVGPQVPFAEDDADEGVAW
jgi:RNA polymerase sigma-70 factor, ECF subfamily